MTEKEKAFQKMMKEAAFQRDNERCRWCGTTLGLNMHHVVYRSGGGSDSERNLITLCAKHHAQAHSNKRLYQPVLLTLLDLEYEEGRSMTVEATMRWMDSNP